MLGETRQLLGIETTLNERRFGRDEPWRAVTDPVRWRPPPAQPARWGNRTAVGRENVGGRRWDSVGLAPRGIEGGSGERGGAGQGRPESGRAVALAVGPTGRRARRGRCRAARCRPPPRWGPPGRRFRPAGGRRQV